MTKKIFAIVLSFILLMCGCSVASKSETVSETVKSDFETTVGNSEGTVQTTEEDTAVPYVFDPGDVELNDPDLLSLIEDNIYLDVTADLDTSKYYVQDVTAQYISQEYIDELEFNSQSNLYFGYTTEELDDIFQDVGYVFSLGKDGETIVTEFEKYDNTYERALLKVAIGTGVIVVCVVIAVVTEGAGVPAIAAVFSCAAKSGAIAAVSSGAISAATSGAITAYQTSDKEAALKAAAREGSNSFMWGAIVGSITGGAKELLSLKKIASTGLTLNEATQVQKEGIFSPNVLKQLHTKEEYEALKAADLKEVLLDGNRVLVKQDIDLNLIDEFGRTNIERMRKGLSALDAQGDSYELHHIGQNVKGTLAMLSRAEHDNSALHKFKTVSEIDRGAFNKTRKDIWKAFAALIDNGVK